MFRRFLFRLASFGKTVSRSFMKILSELYLLLFYFVHWKSSSLCRGGSPRYKVHKIWLTVARLIGLSLVLYPLWAELLHLVCIYTRIDPTGWVEQPKTKNKKTHKYIYITEKLVSRNTNLTPQVREKKMYTHKRTVIPMGT